MTSFGPSISRSPCDRAESWCLVSQSFWSVANSFCFWKLILCTNCRECTEKGIILFRFFLSRLDFLFSLLWQHRPTIHLEEKSRDRNLHLRQGNGSVYCHKRDKETQTSIVPLRWQYNNKLSICVIMMPKWLKRQGECKIWQQAFCRLLISKRRTWIKKNILIIWYQPLEKH